MVTKVYLIRHGETENADARRYKGQSEVPLSENGIAQIRKLSEYLAQNAKLTEVYTSNLGRAVQSAEIIAQPHGVMPVAVEGLRERNFGIWEGMTFDEIKGRWPDSFNAWAANPLQFSPMEGESTIEVRDRAMRAFHEITEGDNGAQIAIVAHGGINRVILCELLGMPLENLFRIEQDFAAVNVIELWDYPVLKLINYAVR